MADGDIVHHRLPKRFLSVYGQICEGHWEPSDLGYKVLHSLKGQLRSYGSGPVVMGKDIAAILEEASMKLSSGREVVWAELQNQIEIIIQKPNMGCSPRGRSLIEEAGKEVLLNMKYGRSFENVRHEVFRTYCDVVYKKDFEAVIQDTAQHYKDASHDEIECRKHDIRPYVEQGLDKYAKQLDKYGNAEQLRRPRRLKEPSLTVADPAW